jgi:hypothetical protein
VVRIYQNFYQQRTLSDAQVQMLHNHNEKDMANDPN